MKDLGNGTLPERRPGHLSQRSARATKPALSYFDAFLKAKERLWTPEDPEGNIVLSVAENRLSADIIKERLDRAVADFPQDALGYQDMRGLPCLRQALARLLEDTFMQGISVDPAHLTVSAGAGAIIENLFFCIADAGDAVLIPAPYYPAFDNDLTVKCALRPVPFHLDEQQPVGPQLQAAAAAARAGGAARVAALLIATPNNPLGTVYGRDTVLGMLRWCLAEGVHLVSDEIYGNSVFGKGASFTSTEVLARQEAAGLPHSELLPELLHVVWGLSKDFCASGLRVGCLHSRSSQLSMAMDNLGYFCAVPNPQQWALAAVLGDGPWLRGFLEENTRRLRQAYAGLEAALVEAGIPHVKANSAMFCWIDLRSWLDEPTWEAEARLWEEMCTGCRVLLTPGEQCHGPEPGYFRVCWAWMPHAGALPVAVRRLAERFGSRAKAAGRQGRQDGAGPTGTVVVAAGGGEGSVEVEAASNGAV